MQVNGKAADALADPDEYGNLFPDWAVAKQVEAVQMAASSKAVPAAAYPTVEAALSRDLIALAASPTLAPQVRVRFSSTWSGCRGR